MRHDSVNPQLVPDATNTWAENDRLAGGMEGPLEVASFGDGGAAGVDATATAANAPAGTLESGVPGADAPPGDVGSAVPGADAPPGDAGRPGARDSAPQRPKLAQFVVFVAIFLIWDLLWWSPIAWALYRVVAGGVWTMAGLVALGVLPLFFLIRSFTGGGAPGAFARIFVQRPFWYLQLFLPVLSIGTLVGGLAGWAFVGFTQGMRWGVAVTLCLIVLFALAGYWGANRVVLRRLDIGFPHLPVGLDGLRIAQLSDLHVGPHTRRGQIQTIRAAVDLAAPHLVALTGDLVDDHAPDVASMVPLIEGWSPALGVVAIPGNHDVFIDWPSVRRNLEAQDVRVLVNESVPLQYNGSDFVLAGTGDPAGARVETGGVPGPAPDLEATMAGIPRTAFSIVLAHNPALWPGLASYGARLTLSGHTHHGQLSIPRWNWCLASPFLKYAMGHYVEDDAVLYINPGTNYWGIPLRLGAWPEVTLVTLRRHGGDWASPSVIGESVERIHRNRRV